MSCNFRQRFSKFLHVTKIKGELSKQLSSPKWYVKDNARIPYQDYFVLEASVDAASFPASCAFSAG